MIKLIGLCGFARSGKNAFGDMLKDICSEQTGNKSCAQTLSFAYALRKELDSFTTAKLGISSFTEDPEKKEIIRPLLVCWGTDIMRNKIDKNYWVKKIQKPVEINRKNKISSIITDVRFENELDWIRQNKGISIFIEREGVEPKNNDELNFTQPLKQKCDYIFSWPNLNNLDSEGKQMIKSFLSDHNICH